MKKQEPTNEKEIWELYQKKCQQEGKEPSIDDFKAWTKTLLRQL